MNSAAPGDWLPKSPYDLFGLDPADPPRLPTRSAAPLGVTIVIPTCPDPDGSRATTLATSLRMIATSAQRSGLPVAVLVAADRVPVDTMAALVAEACPGCPHEVVPVGGDLAKLPPSAARTRNQALAALAALPSGSPLRQRYLLFLDDDSGICPGGMEALVSVLESQPAAIAACPDMIAVPDLTRWHPPSPSPRLAVDRLPGPWRDGRLDLLTVNSHGRLIAGRIAGMMARMEPLMAWIAAGSVMFCPMTPRGSAEDMLAVAALTMLGPILRVPDIQAADQVRATPASTRTQQLSWGYDHAWLVRVLTSVGLVRDGVTGLVWREDDGWQEVHAMNGLGPEAGILVNPSQLTVLSNVFSAVAADGELAGTVFAHDPGELAAAAASMTRVLEWWNDNAAAGDWRPRPELPARHPDDWASLRDGLESRLAHIAGNALASLHSGLNDFGLPRHLLFGIRQHGISGRKAQAAIS